MSRRQRRGMRVDVGCICVE